MSIHRLNEMIKKAAKAVYDSEKFAVDFLAVKAKKAAEDCPSDPTLVAMSRFLTKKADQNQFLITRAELKSVYNKVYVPKNKFAELFVEELGLTEAPSPVTKAQSDYVTAENDFNKYFKDSLDPVLVDGLKTAFDKTVKSAPVSEKLLKSASYNCKYELTTYGLDPDKVNVVNSSNHSIICEASYNTPKGVTSFLVPVEIKEGEALLPSVFVGKNGIEDLSKVAVTRYLLENTGKTHNVNVTKLASLLKSIKEPNVDSINEVERAVMKNKIASETPASYSGITGLTVDSETSLVQELQVEKPQELLNVAAKLESKAGEAEFIFGKKAYDISRNLVVFALKNAGLRGFQVSANDVNKDGIVFGCSLNGRGFKVPVKIANNQPQEPSLAICDGNVVGIDSGLSEVLLNSVGDLKVTAVNSEFHGLRPNDLLKQIKLAMIDGNYVKAEDCLNVLEQTGDKAVMDEAFQVYKDGLAGKTAAVKTSCSKAYKSNKSMHLICAHTNLPVNKVVQDKYGNCRPATFKEADCDDKGVAIMNTKIYL
jgi:hypothetical protein